jgi:hypothetical protein
MSRLDSAYAFRSVPQKCRLQARLAHGGCFEAESRGIPAEVRCLQNACSRGGFPARSQSDARQQRRDLPRELRFASHRRLVDAGFIVLGGPRPDGHRVVARVEGRLGRRRPGHVCARSLSETHLRVDRIDPGRSGSTCGAHLSCGSCPDDSQASSYSSWRRHHS